MEKENINRPNQREVLLSEAWANKREREDINANLAMYVALESSSLNPESIIKGTLQQMMSNPTRAFSWAKDWGRVVVAVHPTKLGTVELGEVGMDTKSYLPIESSRLVDPQELDFSEFEKGKNLILLNKQPVTVEGLVVEIIHLVDGLVWERSLANRKTMSPEKAFREAISQIVQEGIQIVLADETEILELKQLGGEDVQLRIYGSKAIKSVPDLMGAVSRLEEAESSSLIISDVGREITLNKDKIELEGQISFGTGVTLGKPLHIGHLLLIGIAESGRRAVDGDQLRIFSNDTAPRVAQMLAVLSVDLGLSVEETARMLRIGEISTDLITQAYRGRERELGVEILKLAEIEVLAGGGLLKAMEDETLEDLVSAGFGFVKLVRESEIINRTAAEITEYWGGGWLESGYMIARTGRGLSVLQKGGQLTGTAKVLAFMMDAVSEVPGICLVDSERDSGSAVSVGVTMGIECAQLPGIGGGAGLGGEAKSGTSGQLPTLSEVIEVFGENTSELINYFVLTQPLVSNRPPDGVSVLPFYDFASGQQVIEVLFRVNQDLETFKGRVRSVIEKLDSASSEETITVDSREINLIDRLPLMLGDVEISTKVVLENMGKLKLVGDTTKTIAEKWKNVLGDNALEEILRLNQRGIATNLELAKYFVEEGLVHVESKLPERIVNIQSRFLRLVEQQGYVGEEAIQRVMEFMSGKQHLSQRSNPYMSRLVGLLSLSESIDQWEAGDASMVKELILLNLQKLGINI